jgi:endonuclease G
MALDQLRNTSLHKIAEFMGIRMKKSLFLFFAVLISATACKRTPTCNDQFVDGTPPVFTNQKLAAKTQMLCFEGYAVMYSGVSRTPLWSAEHLTANRVQEAKGMKRQNAFHAEEQLPASDRSELHDYAHSGYDRGHMSPSGDMPDATSQYESFSLANMIPQNPKNNQNLWAEIEETTRNLTLQEGELYVITGPLFDGNAIERINGRVFVPTHIFKVIYDPSKHATAAYVVENAPGREYETISVADLEKRSGINFFPKLDPQTKANIMALPGPIPHERKYQKEHSRRYAPS